MCRALSERPDNLEGFFPLDFTQQYDRDRPTQSLLCQYVPNSSF